MAQYQVWLLDETYSKLALITRYARLQYKQALNAPGYATLELHVADATTYSFAPMQRLLIIRDSEIVFGGIILRLGWTIEQETMRGAKYTIHALDHTWYATKRLVVPSNGYDTRTDHAEDVAKAYVYYHLGAGAGERAFADVSVEADAHAAPTITESGRYVKLLTLLQGLANKGGFDWRFEPTLDGCEFRTAYPYWGVDRRKGNGVNPECVFSLDRRNVLQMDYVLDAIEHENYLYVGGQGQGEDRLVVERYDADYVDAYGRLEAFVDARRFSLEESLEAEGDAELRARVPVQVMSVKPTAASWKTLWDLGDLVTLYADLYGEVFSMDAQIVTLTVTVSPDELENVVVELEKYG